MPAAPTRASPVIALTEERFRILVSSIEDYAIFLLDPEGYVVSWNEGARRIKGYNSDEILGKHVSIFYTEDDRCSGKPSHDLDRARELGRMEDTGWRIRKEGTRFRANVVLSAIRDDSRAIVGFAKVTRDVTERMEAEERIRELNATLERRVAERTRDLARRTAELERSNAELERILHVCSHDLKEPLRIVTYYAQLLGRFYKGRLDVTADRYLAHLCTGARRMYDRISAILDYTVTDEIPLHATEVDIGEALRDATDRLAEEIRLTGARIESSTLPVLHTDREAVVRVFEALIGNAIKFRGECAPVVKVSARNLEGRYVLTVSDNAEGIAPEHWQRVFKVFHRLHRADTHAGTGIGLAVTKRLVERLGGTIWVDSIPGKGSAFHVTLPDRAEATTA